MVMNGLEHEYCCGRHQHIIPVYLFEKSVVIYFLNENSYYATLTLLLHVDVFTFLIICV